MNQNINSQMNPTLKGVDIYLYMDYSVAKCKDFSSMVCLGRTKSNSEYWDDRKLAYWLTDTFSNIVKSIYSVLNSEDNRVSVAICGHERYIMTGLTNNIDTLKKCMNVKKFAFGGGEVCPCSVPSLRGYNPYKEMYCSIKNDRKLCPGRKAVGIIVTQSNIREDKIQETLSTINLCSKNNIDIITIGIRNKKVEYEKPIDKTILFSNNKDLSVICDYDDMLNYLKKLVRLKTSAVLKEKEELEQDIKKFCNRQKRYDEYAERLLEFEKQYKNLPDIKLHESNIIKLWEKKKELGNKNRTEHFGLGWIILFGILLLVILLLNPLEKWISAFLANNPDIGILDLKILFITGIPIFALVAYLIKDSLKHYLFISFIVTIIIAKIISLVIVGLSIVIINANSRFSEYKFMVVAVVLVIEVMLILKKIIRQKHVEERYGEMRQIHSEMNCEFTKMEKVISALYKKIYDSYEDVGSDRISVQEVQQQLLFQYKERYYYN